MKTKTIAMIMAMTMILVGLISGTLAWLTDSTDSVNNTFTTADIEVTLTETFNTDSNNDGKTDKWQAQMIPGFSYTKDPVVTVSAESVDCFLFVKFEEKESASTYLTYTSTLTAANGWTQGDGTNIPIDVWYRRVMANDATKTWHLLANDKITVNGDAVTADNMSAAVKAELVYTAYATQLYKESGVEFDAKDAWAKVKPAT